MKPRSAGLLILLLLAACASPTETAISIDAKIELAEGERIVLFPSARAGIASSRDFVDCVRSAIAELGVPDDAIMATEAFQDALFPWFEPAHAPQSVAELESLLSRSKVRQTIAAIEVRYLLAMALRTESDGFPGMLCVASYAGAGCLGLAWSSEETRLDALVWDLATGRESGEITATSSGTSMSLGVVIPLVFVAYTEEEVCEAVAGALGDVLGPE